MDLLSSRPFWPIRDGLPASFPPLQENTSCDVAIVGGGITGALIASTLTEAGVSVVVLDRREIAHGSTAGNTGLLLYELDVMLHGLAERIGVRNAQRAYVRCCRAVTSFKHVIARSRIPCEFAPRPSLYLAAIAAHVPRLRREFEAREAAGLKVDWWPRTRIRAESTLPHAAAILSHDAAELDAYRLTYGLLLAAQRRGARVHDRTTVLRRIALRDGVELITSRRRTVRARHLVVASGYETRISRSAKFGELHSTYALVTEPLTAFTGWPGGRCLIWDTGDPYLYLRTTPDNRAIIGGYDEPFGGAGRRDRLLGAKTTALRRRLRQFFPRMPFEIATAWAGTFGVSPDGLPFIGQHPDVPHTWFALGFGGNGVTFSVIAAEVIRGAVLGDPDPDAALFSFGRLPVEQRDA
jgi:glycine/D-amino acid oxidase-like deaminating enzyme